MKIRALLLALVASFYSSYSYSETISGVSPNAAALGNSWVMSNVLPDQAGLTVGGVAYRYTVNKIIEDAYRVYVENLNPTGDGITFQSMDDWSGLPGNTIKKTVGVPDVLIDLWGEGRIRTEGTGSVNDVNVTYYFKYDECYDPISNPICPGWASALYTYLIDNNLLYEGVEFEDPYWNEFVQALLAAKAVVEEIKEIKEPEEEKEEKEEDLEKLMAIRDFALDLISSNQQEVLEQLTNSQTIDVYRNNSIDGREYLDKLTLVDKKIEDNKSAARMGLASSVMHEKMVSSQYE